MIDSLRRTLAGAAVTATVLTGHVSLAGLPSVEESKDVVLLDGMAANQGGEFGSSARFAWLRSWHPRFTSSAGVDRTNVGNVRWAFASLGGVVRAGAATVVHGFADVGTGEDENDTFAYGDYRMGVQQAFPRRLHARFEARRMNVRDTRASLVSGGATLLDRRGRSYDVSYHTSIGGNLDVRTVVARFEATARRFRWFTGAAGGLSPIDPQLAVDLGSGSFVEGFCGVTSKWGSKEVTVSVDVSATPTVRRSALQVGVRLPL